jgi:hypothetical protein
LQGKSLNGGNLHGNEEEGKEEETLTDLREISRMRNDFSLAS